MNVTAHNDALDGGASPPATATGRCSDAVPRASICDATGLVAVSVPGAPPPPVLSVAGSGVVGVELGVVEDTGDWVRGFPLLGYATRIPNPEPRNSKP